MEQLRTLWLELRTSGVGGGVRLLKEGDLNFVVTADEILDEYVDGLVELGRYTWAGQVEGLQRLFESTGVRQ